MHFFSQNHFVVIQIGTIISFKMSSQGLAPLSSTLLFICKSKVWIVSVNAPTILKKKTSRLTLGIVTRVNGSQQELDHVNIGLKI